MDDEELSDSDILALFADATRKQSPQSFSEWCGCDIDIAIAIWSSAFVCGLEAGIDFDSGPNTNSTTNVGITGK